MENSPLKKLPAELCNRIAEIALYHDGEITIGGTSNSKFRHCLALAQTCKAMRKAYTQLFFAINAFTSDGMGRSWMKDISHFEYLIGSANCKAISSMTVVCKIPDSEACPTGEMYSAISNLARELIVSRGKNEAMLLGGKPWPTSSRIPIEKPRLQITRRRSRVPLDFVIDPTDPIESLNKARRSVQDQIQAENADFFTRDLTKVEDMLKLAIARLSYFQEWKAKEPKKAEGTEAVDVGQPPSVKIARSSHVKPLGPSSTEMANISRVKVWREGISGQGDQGGVRRR